MSRMRVGSTVYDEMKNVVAIFTHGAWYSERKSKNNCVEYEPLPMQQAAEFEALPDVLHLTMAYGELAIVETIRQCLESQGNMDRDAVVTDVHRGVAEGLRKYGPFNPANDSRALHLKAQKAVRNALVYCGMYMLASGQDTHNMHDVVIRLARLWHQVARG